jgi:hypothetical protein
MRFLHVKYHVFSIGSMPSKKPQSPPHLYRRIGSRRNNLSAPLTCSAGPTQAGIYAAPADVGFSLCSSFLFSAPAPLAASVAQESAQAFL